MASLRESWVGSRVEADMRGASHLRLQFGAP